MGNIISKCEGCKKIAQDDNCSIWQNPAAKWSFGNCPTATNITRTIVEQKKVNPIKLSKRMKKGKK